MRLLTVHRDTAINDSSRGRWESRLEDDLIIKPNARVALLSANIQYDDKLITIDDDNNQFIFATSTNKLNAGQVGNVTLETGSYSSDNFIKAMTRALNKGMTNTSANLGTAARATKNSNGNFEIDIATLNDKTKNKDMIAGGDASVAGNVLSRPGTAGANWQGFAQMGKKAWNNGYSEASVQLTSFTAGDEIAFGFAENIEDLGTRTTLAPSALIAYMSVNSSGNYTVNGVQVAGPVAATNNDTMTMRIDGGEIKFIKITSGTPTELGTFNYSGYSDKRNYLYTTL